MEKKEEIEQLKKQLNDISDKIKQLEKPQFEVNKWYKHSSPEKEKILIYATDLYNDGWFNCFGWNICGDWISSPARSYNNNGYIPATDKEVEEALIAEAKKRGFKEGVKINREHFKLVNYNTIVDGERYGNNYDAEYNGLSFGGVYVFENGKWAEIVKEEKIMIRGYEVVKENRTYKIGCKRISESEMKALRDLMYNNDFINIKLSNEQSNYIVGLETINKILDIK
jgi:hypothetical protein